MFANNIKEIDAIELNQWIGDSEHKMRVLEQRI